MAKFKLGAESWLGISKDSVLYFRLRRRMKLSLEQKRQIHKWNRKAHRHVSENESKTAQCGGGESQTLTGRNDANEKKLNDFLYPLYKESRMQYRTEKDCLRAYFHNKQRTDKNERGMETQQIPN